MKILFIHGLASSGAFKTADALRLLFKPCEVISPDVPEDPDAAFALLRGICEAQKPDLVVGLSLGGFWAQKLRGVRKVLINPEFHPYRLMRTMMGECRYLCPRADGAETFVITEEMCRGYESLADVQFEGLDTREKSLTRAMFADADELVDCRDEFVKNYPEMALDYPGGHLPTFPQLKSFLVPLVEDVMR